MVFDGDDREALFTSHAWRRLFGVRAPLVREIMLEFFSTCRMSDTEMGLDVADTLCFQLGGARRRMTWRQFILSLDLHSEEEMADPGDFLGPAPSYVYIRDPVRRKGGTRLSEGHFIGRLAAHFGLVGDQGLIGLSMVVSELLVIDLHELVRLNICSRFGDMWAWVAPRPERQQAAAASGAGAAEDAPAADEDA
ncbi:hypothetical protein Tco_0961578 [Tanacetum coccineum]